MERFRFKAYEITKRAVCAGTEYGISRAHKHTDNPTMEHLGAEIEQAIMFELSEVIDFDADTGPIEEGRG